MFKKSVVLLCILSAVFFSSCSREKKFGAEQFVSRMNERYEANLDIASFSLGVHKDGRQYLLAETESGLLALEPDSNSTIRGISLSAERGASAARLNEEFLQMCCVLTSSEEDAQRATLKNCGITPDSIKFADGCSVNTVGKYKYTVVSNEFAFTLFCERV